MGIEALADFSELSPDEVLNRVEAALGRPTSNLCRPLSSYINRVYEVQLDDGAWVVAKFYRPGRWSRAALQDEQDFVTELAEAEIPVVAPLPGPSGQTLHVHQGMYFAIFPKRGGRPLDEPRDGQWQALGRLLARLHVVGSQRAPRDRIRLGPATSMRAHREFILRGEFPTPRLRRAYERITALLIERITPLFEGVPCVRIHGDCHRANILERPGEPFVIIDFDDMAVGPPVQDLWMLLPGHLKESQIELNGLLEGYETFRSFDHASLRLIEPLRAMRMIHFTAWCAHQRMDGGFMRVAPGWGTAAYWQQAVEDLERQLCEIEDGF